MSRKRRRRKPRGPGRQPRGGPRPAAGAGPDAGGDRRAGDPEQGGQRAGRAPRGERPAGEAGRDQASAEGRAARQGGRGERRPGGLFGRPAVPSPFPPFAVSMARGLRVVGGSAPLLAATFLSALATWGTVVALGADASLRYLVVEMAASPLHVFFDVDPIFRLGGTSTDALVTTAALGAVRGVTFGLLLLLIAARLRGEPDLAAALRPLPKVALSLFAVYVAEVAAVLGTAELLVGLLGPASRLILPLVALHFLAFVPVVVALERTTARDGLVRGLRAARLPAGRHLLMMVFYFLFSLYLASGTPPLAPATPSILGWAFALAVSFLHVSVTAALAYRWLAVRREPAVVQSAKALRGQGADAGGRRSR